MTTPLTLFLVAIVLALINILLSNVSAQSAEGIRHDKLVVCYVGTWAYYRPGNGKFDTHHINPSLCTHAIYAFASLNEMTNSITSHDTHRDITLKGFQEFVGLKEKNPKLKVLIAIGGWNEGAQKYSWMADGKNNRTQFIESVVHFLKLHKFDGLDLDWEYPAAHERGGRPEDRDNFAALVKELKETFLPHGWLLTAALGAAPKVIKEGYNVPILSKHLDIINVMCYDYHGQWDKKTGHNAPLYSSPNESPSDQTLNVNSTISLLLMLGAERHKIAVGMSFYGRSFKVKRGSDMKPGTPIDSQTGRTGPYSNQTGFMGYNEFCELMQEEKWITERDSIQRVPYAYREDNWFSYDDVQSIKEKVHYVNKQRLGGAMIWSIETDDFLNICKEGKFPLLTAINSALEVPEEEENVIDDKTTKSPTKTSTDSGTHIAVACNIILTLLSAVFLVLI